MITTGTSGERKRAIEALIQGIRITENGDLIPIFKIPGPRDLLPATHPKRRTGHNSTRFAQWSHWAAASPGEPLILVPGSTLSIRLARSRALGGIWRPARSTLVNARSTRSWVGIR